MTGAMLLTGKEMQGAQVRHAIWALIRYLVLMPLKHVVSPRSEVQEGLLNHSHHELSGLLFTGILLKPLLQLLDGLAAETGQARVQHQLNQVYEGVAVRPHCQISFHTQLHEPLEGGSLHLPSHDIHKLRCQLHVRLKRHVASRRGFKHEAKVDVNDVAIVSVLDLEKESQHTICRH